MRKTLSAIALLLFACSIVFTQSESQISSKTNPEAATNASQQTDYSESVPYKPREFKVKAESSKSEKKPKRNSERENQTVAPVAATPKETNENPIITENSFLTVPVSVLDAAGKPVENLGKSDFKIYIDGQEQEIAGFGVYDEPLNLVLILDVSPSTYFDIERIREYAATVVKQLRPQDKVMVITFDESAQMLVDLTDNRKQIDKALKKVNFGDGTSLYETISDTLQKRINQIDGRKFVVLLTDGVDTTSTKATFADSLLEAEKNDALFFPIYLDTYPNVALLANRPIISNGRMLGDNQLMRQILSQIPAPPNRRKSSMSVEEQYERGRQYLADIALLSGGKAVAVENLRKLNKDGFENVFEAFRNQYYLKVNFSGAGKVGQRRQIKVRVNRPNLAVKTRGSYLVGEKGQTLPANSK